MAPAIEAVMALSSLRAGTGNASRFPRPCATVPRRPAGPGQTEASARPGGRQAPAGGGAGAGRGLWAPGWARISAALGQGRCPCHGGRVRPFTPAVAASSAAFRRLKARHDPSRPDRDVCPGSSRTTRGIPRRQLSARRVCPPGGAATALPVGPPPDADPGKTRRPDHRRGAAGTLADRGQIATPTDGPATGAKAPGPEGWPVRPPLTLPGEPVSLIAPTVAFFLSWWLSRSYVHDRNRDRARPG